MNLWPFTRRAPTPAEAARALSKVRVERDRAKVRAVARIMRKEMGLPKSEALA